jgi:hypothetical protein
VGYDNLVLEITDAIATITIDHPPANAWDLATMEAFEKAVAAVENDSEVRVVILTGAGEKCFSAGFDVRDAANAAVISPKGRDLWRRIDRFPKPVIAAINGYALGGGFELALACHFRIMANDPNIVVGLTELNLGIIPGWGGTQRLARLVGRAKALDMILFSRRIGPAEALRPVSSIGFLHRKRWPKRFSNLAGNWLSGRRSLSAVYSMPLPPVSMMASMQDCRSRRKGVRSCGKPRIAMKGFALFWKSASPASRADRQTMASTACVEAQPNRSPHLGS